MALALALLWLTQPVGGSVAWGQNPAAVAAECNLKLARLFVTAKFITWPDEGKGSTTPFIIGVLEPDPFQGGLQKLAERKLKDRPIRVVLIKSAEDYQRCHLLFIPAQSKPELIREIVKRTASQPVLVWRDSADVAPSSGVVCTFVLQGDALLIEADPTEIKRRGLIADARLLNLNLVRIVKASNTPTEQ